VPVATRYSLNLEAIGSE